MENTDYFNLTNKGRFYQSVQVEAMFAVKKNAS